MAAAITRLASVQLPVAEAMAAARLVETAVAATMATGRGIITVGWARMLDAVGSADIAPATRLPPATWPRKVAIRAVTADKSFGANTIERTEGGE
jgi:hypothetical protein